LSLQYCKYKELILKILLQITKLRTQVLNIRATNAIIEISRQKALNLDS